MNYTLSELGMFVSLALSISGFMIGAASFLIGLYMQKYDKFESKNELRPYPILIISLIISTCVVIVLGSLLIFTSNLPIFSIQTLAIFLLSPAIPIIVILYILARHWPRGSKTG